MSPVLLIWLSLSAGLTTVPSVSELLPNLESLASLLEHATGAKADALALVITARPTSSVAELDEAIRGVVEGWRAL